MAERNPMTAVGDTITVPLNQNGGGAVAAQLSAGSVAGGTAVLEVSANGADWVGPVRMRNPVANADIDSLVGPNASGWADVPGYQLARLRCTVAGGNVIGRLNQL